MENGNIINKIKRAHYYLFYKLYKWYENSEFAYWSDWKAGISIMVLEIGITMSIFCYYQVFIDRYFRLNRDVFIGIGILIFLFNYYYFTISDRWKKYFKEFEKLPKKKNILGGWLVFGFIILIIANIIFSFYLMSLIDWGQYKK